MRPVCALIYRYLTPSDFYNMYKPHESESGGGGQTYVDFPTQDVAVADWEKFFHDVEGVRHETRAQGPAWTVPIRSIGLLGNPQAVEVYQRRQQTVSVAKQTLGRSTSNRVEAWRPENGFPSPTDPNDRHQLPAGLAVYFVRTDDDTIWAGWFLNRGPASLPASLDVQPLLRNLLTVPNGNRHRAGIIEIDRSLVWLDKGDKQLPFKSQPPNALNSGTVPQADAERSYLPPPTPPARVAERRQRETARATDAQGRQLDPARRKAVELHAMALAKQAYSNSEDTSATESFDLRAFESGAEVRVEVKGTLGTGEYVLVTANEVDNSHGPDWRTDLFVVSEIDLTRRENGEYVAQGGVIPVVRGWRARSEDLTPTQYRYRVPGRTP